MMKAIFFTIIAALPLLSCAQIEDSTKRQVKLQGAVNFRDIGGYQTRDGRHVQWGRIYRSAALNNLTADDWQKIGGLRVSRIADFRGPYEVKSAPDKELVGITRISLSAGSENLGDSTYMKTFLKDVSSGKGLTDFYANTAPFKARYKPLFDELISLNKDSALLFHCTAGKDRTGIAAALVLYALGVDEETIMNDYLATNYYRAGDNQRMIAAFTKGYGLTEAQANNVMAAKAEYLNATFNAIKSGYGSVDNYLEKELGLSDKKREKLKHLYLK